MGIASGGIGQEVSIFALDADIVGTVEITVGHLGGHCHTVSIRKEKVIVTTDALHRVVVSGAGVVTSWVGNALSSIRVQVVVGGTGVASVLGDVINTAVGDAVVDSLLADVGRISAQIVTGVAFETNEGVICSVDVPGGGEGLAEVGGVELVDAETLAVGVGRGRRVEDESVVGVTTVAFNVHVVINGSSGVVGQKLDVN